MNKSAFSGIYFFAGIICIFVFLTAPVCTVIAAEDYLTYVEGCLTYRIENDNTAVITKCDKNISGALSIPASLGGYPVRGIGYGAFAKCDNLVEVTIPEGVTYLSYDAFYRCSNLTKITLPESMSTIANYAFFECYSIEDVYYAGSRSQWVQISISTDYNDYLKDANIHFNWFDGLQLSKPFYVSEKVKVNISAKQPEESSDGYVIVCDKNGMFLAVKREKISNQFLEKSVKIPIALNAGTYTVKFMLLDKDGNPVFQSAEQELIVTENEAS